MPKSNNTRFSSLREAKKALNQISTTSRGDSQHYRLDRDSIAEYFKQFPKWSSEVRQFLFSHKEESEPLVSVDICGRATAGAMGPAESWSFSLQPIPDFDIFSSRHKDDNGSDLRYVGDVFSSRDFNRFISALRNKKRRPALVVFEPVAGLESFLPLLKNPVGEEICYCILGRQLARIVHVMMPGGYLLLGPAFQGTGICDFLEGKPQNMYKSSLHVKSLCRKLKCRVKIESTLNGPRWLIKKGNNL